MLPHNGDEPPHECERKPGESVRSHKYCDIVTPLQVHYRREKVGEVMQLILEISLANIALSFLGHESAKKVLIRFVLERVCHFINVTISHRWRLPVLGRAKSFVSSVFTFEGSRRALGRL